ncbi:hypothetical protein GF374_00045 [Candidatus Woesearchaeota archaeon]|nr:hypothetical protein [Candidatus Woesearchaeota archaeon]
MAKKKKSRKRKSKKKVEELSWPELGSMIAGKVEKEHFRRPPKVWGWNWTNVCRPKGGHFLAALVFAVAFMYVLGQQGIIFDQVDIWLKALLALAFAWMFS